jgi:hypothetical protein
MKFQHMLISKLFHGILTLKTVEHNFNFKWLSFLQCVKSIIPPCVYYVLMYAEFIILVTVLEVCMKENYLKLKRNMFMVLNTTGITPTLSVLVSYTTMTFVSQNYAAYNAKLFGVFPTILTR